MSKYEINLDVDSLSYSLGHCECYCHTVHKFSQRRLTAEWLAAWESDCSRMYSNVSSDWLPSYIKTTRPVFEIFKMAGSFPVRPRTSIWPVLFCGQFRSLHNVSLEILSTFLSTWHLTRCISVSLQDKLFCCLIYSSKFSNTELYSVILLSVSKPCPDNRLCQCYANWHSPCSRFSKLDTCILCFKVDCE
jgi:hypothetical protein